MRVGKGGHETLIEALRRLRRAHAEPRTLPRDFAWARRHSPSKTGLRAPLPTLRFPFAAKPARPEVLEGRTSRAYFVQTRSAAQALRVATAGRE
jgi:hypothetical protein